MTSKLEFYKLFCVTKAYYPLTFIPTITKMWKPFLVWWLYCACGVQLADPWDSLIIWRITTFGITCCLAKIVKWQKVTSVVATLCWLLICPLSMNGVHNFSSFHVCSDFIYWNVILCLINLIIQTVGLYSVSLFFYFTFLVFILPYKIIGPCCIRNENRSPANLRITYLGVPASNWYPPKVPWLVAEGGKSGWARRSGARVGVWVLILSTKSQKSKGTVLAAADTVEAEHLNGTFTGGGRL